MRALVFDVSFAAVTARAFAASNTGTGIEQAPDVSLKYDHPVRPPKGCRAR